MARMRSGDGESVGTAVEIAARESRGGIVELFLQRERGEGHYVGLSWWEM